MNRFKSILLTTAAAGLAFTGMSVAASAADPIVIAPPVITPAPAIDNWSGFYAGLNAGYGWGELYDNGGVVGPFDSVNGLFAGAQIGANFQHDAIVFGIEADIQWSGLSQTVGGTTVGVDYFGTVRGRLGVDLDGVLPYLTAGLAYGQGSIDVGPTFNEFHWGWTAGVGVEVKLDEQISLKGEYLYVDLGQTDYAMGPDFGYRFHALRAGVNFHF